MTDEIKELVRGIATNEQHLTDCRERRATPHLVALSEAWAGTRYASAAIQLGV